MKIKRLLLKVLLLKLAFLLFTGTMLAQQNKITGTVTDAKTNTVMPGVSVILKGTTIGTLTDMDGKYSIMTSDTNAILKFSFVGYKSVEIPVNTQSQINVSLEEEIKQMDEVVVVGYGTQKKSDLTGAVSVVNTENLQKIASTDLAKVLQGQTSGIQIFGGGEPGAQQKVQIRGIGSFGYNEPLYVIDGVPIAGANSMGQVGIFLFEGNTPGYGLLSPTGGISDFNPADIQSIQVLKDASAAAIYGARGSNGVVIITTKRGKAGATKINYEGSYGVQNIAKRMEMCDRVQFQQLNNDARINDDVFISESNDSTSPNFINNINTDWQKETFKQGHITEHNLSIQGGTENSTYYGNIGCFDQTGTVIGPGPRYTKYSAQVNLDQKKGRFKFGENLSYTYSEQIKLNNTQWHNFITELLAGNPTVAVYDTANKIGGWGGRTLYMDQDAGNPVAFNNIFQTTVNRTRFLGVVYGELEMFKFLSYRINLSYDRSDWHNRQWIPVWNTGGKYKGSIASLAEWRGESPTKLVEHLLNFKQVIGKHDITAIAGYTAQKDFSNELYATASGYTEPYMEVISYGKDQSSLGKLFEHSMISYLGRINYSYDDKYLLTASFRQDYSSNFGPENKFGRFPSFALGWKISNESFIKNNFPIINLLKLRGGWGKIGNEKILSYKYVSTVNNAATYYFGSNSILNPGTTQTLYVDPSVHWEERVTTDIGFDLAMLQNKLEISAEYYKNDAYDILIPFPIPISSGVVGWNVEYANGASMTNKGIEISVSYKKFEGDFHYSIGGNITTIKNVVTKIGKTDTPREGAASIEIVGQPMGEIYGYIAEGIFQDSSEINFRKPGAVGYDPTRHAWQSGQSQPGDVKFKDINGRDTLGNLTGKPDGQITEDDMTYLGSPIPKFTYGINLSAEYKGFDISVFIQGVYGNKVYNALYAYLSALGRNESNYTVDSYNNYWKSDRHSNTWPRASLYDPNKNNQVSSRWVQDGSYLKLQNVQIGYTIPKRLLKRFRGIDNFRVFIQGQNLLTVTKLWGYDPDFINDGVLNRGYYDGSYPSPRTFMVGVKLGL